MSAPTATTATASQRSAWGTGVAINLRLLRIVGSFRLIKVAQSMRTR
jgi:hypothetical protein